MPENVERDGIVIIGGGVIGVCAAYSLAERGARVTLLEQGDICSGSSYGSAGLIVPSHSIPLPRPGVLGQGLRWLLDVESPFYIKPRLDRDLVSWLIKFSLAARPGPMQRAIPVLLQMSRLSIAMYDELARQNGQDYFYEQRGLLFVYNSEQGRKDALEDAHLLGEQGFALEVLEGEAAREVEPALQPDVLGAVFFREDGHLNPADCVNALARRAERLGARLHTGTEVLGFERAGRRLTLVRTTKGDFAPEQVVLAAGAWSPGVARALGLRLPIQAAKGYSITVRRPEVCPVYPMLLAEARCGVTPMGPLLRFAGTLELAGMDLSINQRRVKAIRRAAPRYLRGLEALELVEIWRGLRPVTPDGLPIIGRAPACDNLIVAAGHAMIGQSLGPITGRLVAQIACGDATEVDLEPFRVGRF